MIVNGLWELHPKPSSLKSTEMKDYIPYIFFIKLIQRIFFGNGEIIVWIFLTFLFSIMGNFAWVLVVLQSVFIMYDNVDLC